MSWVDYHNMSRSERRLLVERAEQGHIPSIRKMHQYTRDIKTEVTKRLAKLERGNLDYGKVYNNLIYFFQTEHNSNRPLSPSALKYDLWDEFQQNEQSLKFLRNKASVSSYAREVEKHRIKALREQLSVPHKFSRKGNIEFLKFLGNEAVSAAIDEYGSSTKIVEEIYNAYFLIDNKAFSFIERALVEFNAGNYKFDEMMENININVENYYRNYITKQGRRGKNP